eukprot:scaffold189122_cov30-Tisochrysis_lutea.AAC.2
MGKCARKRGWVPSHRDGCVITIPHRGHSDNAPPHGTGDGLEGGGLPVVANKLQPDRVPCPRFGVEHESCEDDQRHHHEEEEHD